MCQIDNLESMEKSSPSLSQKTINVSCIKKKQNSTSNMAESSTHHEGSAGFTYRPDNTSEESTLSIRLMHKPSRAQHEFEKVSDPTKQNSILNSQVPNRQSSFYISPPDTKSSQETSGLPSPVERDHSCGKNLPQLLRKKSGEIVKPLLKGKDVAISVRSCSLPTTPTYKQVHFGGDTDVRYFKTKDKPSNISASNSPTHVPEEDDDDYGDAAGPSGLEFELEGDSRMKSFFDLDRKSYFDYFDDELNSHADKIPDKKARTVKTYKTPSTYDWELSLVNFSQCTDPLQCIRNGQYIFLENLFLSADRIFLLGQVAVNNMEYQKSVTVRYSLDNWCTIVEIQAFYVPDLSSALKKHNFDRFVFKIRLDSLVNGFSSGIDPLSTSAAELNFELCIKYLVKDTEFWDNNRNENYRFILKRGSNFSTGANKIPESARTKQEAHKKKPKYSSSYLKKVKSDSSLTTHVDAKPSNDQLRPVQNPSNHSSTDINSENSSESSSTISHDFENNNYYLSSPLFSSFAQNGYYSELQKESSSDVLRDSKPYLEDKKTADCEVSTNRRDYRPDSEPKAFHQISTRSQEPMSYKEFLDSYCFFGSNFNDNNSKATLVMSDGPSLSEEGVTNTELSTGGNSFYTVSSFLA